MYCIVWEYRVDKSKQAAFEANYSRAGAWFKFFEPCDDFLGHDFIKHTDESSYLIIDKWMDKDGYEAFLSSNKADYQRLNDQSVDLYESERMIGTYDTL